MLTGCRKNSPAALTSLFLIGSGTSAFSSLLSLGFLYSCSDQEGALCSRCVDAASQAPVGTGSPSPPSSAKRPSLYLQNGATLCRSVDSRNLIYLLPGPEHLDETAV